MSESVGSFVPQHRDVKTCANNFQVKMEEAVSIGSVASFKPKISAPKIDNK